MVWEDASFAGFPQNTPAPANYADWKAQNQTFEDMVALASRSYNLTGDGEPERVDAHRASANFFQMLGVKPALGRFFLPESALLSFAGAAVGLLFAAWSFSLLRQLIPEGLSLSTGLHIDLRVLAPGQR